MLRIMAIDLGCTRVATVVDNLGGHPIAYSGGPAKEINNLYNKRIAELKREQSWCDPRLAELQKKKQIYDDAVKKKNYSVPGLTDAEWNEWKYRSRYTKRMKRITVNRNNQINAFFHRLSKNIVEDAKNRCIDVIVIGHNKMQKQKINIGDRNNQNFVQMPIFKLINQIRYKAELKGIIVIETSEEFTSKASYIDMDTIPDKEKTKKNSNGHSDVKFSGRRGMPGNWKARGIYTSKDGTLIHSDVNGAYNILRKAFPNALGANGITATGNLAYSGARLHPRVLDIPASGRMEPAEP